MDESALNSPASIKAGTLPIDGGHRKRMKVTLACDRCRRRKIKCDGSRQGKHIADYVPSRDYPESTLSNTCTMMQDARTARKEE